MIDYFRKTNKETTFFVKLLETEALFAVSVITQFEVYTGSKKEHYNFWDKLFNSFTVLALDNECVKMALLINEELKKKNKQIEFADLLIAATAKTYNLSVATLNQKHFNRIAALHLVTKV